MATSHLDNLLSLFAAQNADYRMLTFRSDDPRHQRVGFINNLCRKIANTFFIVREADHKKAGWHFHAMLKVVKEPTYTWFIKGVHMHLTKIGKADSNIGRLPPPINPTREEIATMLHWEPEKYAEVELSVLQAAFSKTVKQRRMDDNKSKVCQYLLKEVSGNPVQYVDYILCDNKKNITL